MLHSLRSQSFESYLFLSGFPIEILCTPPLPSYVLRASPIIRNKLSSRNVYRGRPFAKTALYIVQVPNHTHQGRNVFDVTEEEREMGKFLTYVIDSMGVHLEDSSLFFCYAMSNGEELRTFRKIILRSSSGSCCRLLGLFEGSTSLSNVGSSSD